MNKTKAKEGFKFQVTCLYFGEIVEGGGGFDYLEDALKNAEDHHKGSPSDDIYITEERTIKHIEATTD